MKSNLSSRNQKIILSIAVILALLVISIYYKVIQNKDTGEIRLVTHNAFVFEPSLLKSFEAESGDKVKLIQIGDVGTLTNKLILTKNDPLGDLVFGLDNTFGPIAQKAGLLQSKLIPTDSGEVCFNYDLNYFSTHKINPPKDLSDLTSSRFKNLIVIENPNTSSTGLSLLAATEGKFSSSEWKGFWTGLKANGVKIDNDWEKAYYSDFSGSSGKGNYPIVLSYDSSPADEIRSNGKSQTQNLLDGCFKQTEYISILKGAKNIVGADKLIKFILSPNFQKSFPTTMYMFPINSNIPLPKEWNMAVTRPAQTYGDTLPIARLENKWLYSWNQIFQ
jgi:thiamine transport system substrate-binding protein